MNNNNNTTINRLEITTAFTDYLKRFGKLESGVEHLMEREIVIDQGRRRALLLQEDQVCNNLYYIHQGAAHLARIHGNKQFSTWICMDDDIISNVAAINQPTTGYKIELIEDSQYVKLAFGTIKDLAKHYPSFSNLIQKLSLHQFALMQERSSRSRLLSAAEHYAWIREHHPEADQRLPLNIIASYLGINQASLSRLRRQGYSNK